MLMQPFLALDHLTAKTLADLSRLLIGLLFIIAGGIAVTVFALLAMVARRRRRAAGGDVYDAAFADPPTIEIPGYLIVDGHLTADRIVRIGGGGDD